jgi:proline dehydrogenase
MYAGAKALFYALSRSALLKRLASKYGMRSRDSFARRFIAGETIDEAIEASRSIQAQGLDLTLDYLGESVRTVEEADTATREYIRLLDVIVASGIERNISLKLTQLGAGIDRATCVDNLRRILEPAGRHGFFVRIDMENSPWTQLTLDIFETLWQQDYRNVGIALQAALYRTEQDVRRMNELGARVRLVKGAYKEPKTVAYAKKADVDAAYARMLKVLITDGHDGAIGTHDPAMITLARDWARAAAVTPDRFEFQMLYGVRRDLQTMLVKAGYRVRVYIPFGREWFPYFMRRLGERPANVTFVIRGILGERG